MRYAIVSDLHANWPAWCAVRDDFLAQDVDMVVCLGDVIGYGPSPARVLGDLRKYCRNYVLGNHDGAAVGRVDIGIFNDDARRAAEWTRTQLDNDARRLLQEWPLVLEDQRAIYVHAEIVAPDDWGYVEKPDDVLACLRATDKQVVFLGHTHKPGFFVLTPTGALVPQQVPAIMIAPGVRYLVNVGSVGDPRDGTALASYCLCDFAAGRMRWRQVPFDTAAFLQELKQHPELGIPWFAKVAEGPQAPAHAVRAARVATARPRLVTSRAQISIVAKPVAGGDPIIVATPSTPPAVPRVVQAPAPRRKLVRTWLWMVLLAVLFVGVCFGAWHRFGSYRPAPRPPRPPRVTRPPDLRERFVLQATGAQIHNKKRLRIETIVGPPNLGFWNNIDEYVTWAVTNRGGGLYAVELEYALKPGPDKSAFVISCSNAQLSATLQPTGAWNNFTNTVLGRIDLPQGPATITLKPTSKAGEGVMNLRTLTFRPVTN